jgi:hypothetical protein
VMAGLKRHHGRSREGPVFVWAYHFEAAASFSSVSRSWVTSFL